jgi:two-component system NtrC family sensor kinase
MSDQTPENIDPIAAAEAVQLELDELKAQLNQAHRLSTLGTMAAGVAHEMNNILTPALAYAQLAKSHPDDAELQTKAIDKAATGIETATRIAQQMLNFAAAKDNPDVTGANIADCCSQALQCLVRDPARDGIKVVTAINPALRALIRPLALQQIILNLVLNSCSALRGRGGSVTIKASASHDGRASISISDTGPGIPDSIASRLFQPFVSSATRSSPPMRIRRPMDINGSSDNSAIGGTGLGLTICHRLVTETSGTISVNSAPGRGTTITISLPEADSKLAEAG